MIPFIILADAALSPDSSITIGAAIAMCGAVATAAVGLFRAGRAEDKAAALDVLFHALDKRVNALETSLPSLTKSVDELKAEVRKDLAELREDLKTTREEVLEAIRELKR